MKVVLLYVCKIYLGLFLAAGRQICGKEEIYNRGSCSRLGVQFTTEAKISYVQRYHFIYYQPKCWVRKSAPLRIRFRRPCTMFCRGSNHQTIDEPISNALIAELSLLLPFKIKEIGWKEQLQNFFKIIPSAYMELLSQNSYKGDVFGVVLRGYFCSKRRKSHQCIVMTSFKLCMGAATTLVAPLCIHSESRLRATFKLSIIDAVLIQHELYTFNIDLLTNTFIYHA